MSDEQTPETKQQAEIPVEEVDELKAEEKRRAENVDVAAELRSLGRQFAETIQTAWQSEERRRVESEIREGVRSFADEVDKVINEAKSTSTAEKVKTEATEIKQRVESTDFSARTREGIVQGLHWLSEELNKLADQFTPPEKAPKEAGETAAEEPDTATHV